MPEQRLIPPYRRVTSTAVAGRRSVRLDGQQGTGEQPSYTTLPTLPPLIPGAWIPSSSCSGVSPTSPTLRATGSAPYEMPAPMHGGDGSWGRCSALPNPIPPDTARASPRWRWRPGYRRCSAGTRRGLAPTRLRLRCGRFSEGSWFGAEAHPPAADSPAKPVWLRSWNALYIKKSDTPALRKHLRPGQAMTDEASALPCVTTKVRSER